MNKMNAPEQISVPVWWSSGGMMTRRDCLPSDHPEHTYNYMVRELKVDPEDYGIEKPKVIQCPHCGWAF
jgi:hypothetical protein